MNHRNVTVNLEPGKYIRKMIFSVSDLGGSEERPRTSSWNATDRTGFNTGASE